MKKILLFACLAAIFVFASCKTTTKANPETFVEVSSTTIPHDEVVDEPPVEEPIVEETNDNSDDIAAKNANMTTLVEKARQQAIDANANVEYKEAFDALDLAFNALKNLNDGQDHSEELGELKARYEALASAAKARKLKKQIDDENLAENNQAEYDHGEKALGEFDEMVKNVTTPGKTLLGKANEAYDAYYAVYMAAYKKLANNERKEAIAQKKRADSVKAQISRKDEYTSYAKMITDGDMHYSTQNPEAAYKSYSQAKTSFKALADDVEQKRAAAQKAIDDAKVKVKEAEEYALNADKVNPLEGEVEGIEAEDAVLLEADEFANPDEQIIQIDENL